MNYSSSSNLKSNDLSTNQTSTSSSNNNIYQEILSSDAKYNLYRIHNNSQLSKKKKINNPKFESFFNLNKIFTNRDSLYEKKDANNERECHEI